MALGRGSHPILASVSSLLALLQEVAAVEESLEGAGEVEGPLGVEEELSGPVAAAEEQRPQRIRSADDRSSLRKTSERV